MMWPHPQAKGKKGLEVRPIEWLEQHIIAIWRCTSHTYHTHIIAIWRSSLEGLSRDASTGLCMYVCMYASTGLGPQGVQARAKHHPHPESDQNLTPTDEPQP